MRVRVPGVNKVTKKLANGTRRVFYYHRATGTRLPDDPHTAAFVAAVARLDEQHVETLKPREVGPTLSTLIRSYQASTDWTDLKESTRAVETFNLKAVEAEFGEMELAAIEERGARTMFLEWRDELAEATPRAADAKLARLAKVLAFGLDRELLTRNPLSTFKRAYKGDRSEILWLPEHVAALTAVAPPEVTAAVTLALHTGQRKGDLFALTWSQYDGRAISLRQGKTGARVFIPCTRALKAALDALKAENGARDVPRLHILTTPAGQPWTRQTFRPPWESAFEGSGLKDDLHFHDLRGTAVTMLAEAGCSVPEIASITGHTLASASKILESYLALTKPLAEAAIAKLEVRMRG